MKKIITLCIYLLSLNCYSASPVWKVEHNNNTTFIAGTIHLLHASDYPLPKAFNNAYQKSSLIVFETDLNKMKSPDSINKFINAVKLNNGQSFYDQLKPNTIKLLEQFSIENNLNLSKMSQFKPSFVALTLLIGELQKKGAKQSGVDEFYNQQATLDAKETKGLETIEQQVKFVSNMAEGYEDEFMLQTLEDMKDIDQLFDSMLSSWRKGNLEEIERLFITPNQEKFPNLNQQLLFSRNKAWMPKIKQYLMTPEVEMIMVGSAHLAGKDGLLHSLRSMGYKVTQFD